MLIIEIPWELFVAKAKFHSLITYNLELEGVRLIHNPTDSIINQTFTELNDSKYD